MKIARIETFLFDPGTAKNLLFCRVETEDGHHGWGEAYVTPGKEPVIEHLLHDLAKRRIETEGIIKEVSPSAEQAAKELGLPAGLPVATGTGDVDETGEGEGTQGFTWGALILDMNPA